MNKAVIKKFAKESRALLTDAVRQRALNYTGGYTKNENDSSRHFVNELIEIIERKGLSDLVEEIACDWFCRLIAIRFMEVNELLPSAILKEATWKKETSRDVLSLFHLLEDTFDGVFPTTKGWKELLFPHELMEKDGELALGLYSIEDTEWKDVEIIGWLYQHYNSELKEKAFEKLKNKVKISKDDIPAATQLFTPHWIARYMVENSLGKMYTAKMDEEEQKSLLAKLGWKYYIFNGQEKLSPIISITKKNLPHIRIIDPCMGSGHILVCAFSLLMQIYTEMGFGEEEAAISIVNNNLYGLDIDGRVVCLARFSLIMKAMEHIPQAHGKKSALRPNLFCVSSPKSPTPSAVEAFSGGDEKTKKELLKLLELMKDGDDLGSLINIDGVDLELLNERCNYYEKQIKDPSDPVKTDIIPIIGIARVMSFKYNAVITNPPYMGKRNLNKKLSAYLEKSYPMGKSELYSAFMLKCLSMAEENGVVSMITVHTWMFISSFEGLRKELLKQAFISTMLHTGPSTFEELNTFNVLATAFCLIKSTRNYPKSKFIRLADHYNLKDKLANYHNPKNAYLVDQRDFLHIPGCPYIYWVDKSIRDKFLTERSLGEYFKPKQGLATGDNQKFLRLWHEVCFDDVCLNAKDGKEALLSRKKWFPYNKGGNFRKWYGMNRYVINWENDGQALKNSDAAVIRNSDHYFKSGITWSLFGFENFGVRYKKSGFIFDVSGSSIFPTDENTNYVLAFLASKVAFTYLSILAPTVNFQVGNISHLPLIIDENYKKAVDALAEENIRLSEHDWNSFERSWDFQTHPWVDLYQEKPRPLREIYKDWEEQCSKRFDDLKKNEEELNRIFIKIYGLESSISPEVSGKDVAMHRADPKDDVKALISYAIGCIFGRYSVDAPGLCYTGGQWNGEKYKTVIPAKNNVIPLYDSPQDKDLAACIGDFIKKVFGNDTFDQNLRFIEEMLGAGKEPYSALKDYLNSEFFPQHVKDYCGRPVYWMLSSGKKNAFKAVIYCHRYTPSLLEEIYEKYMLPRYDYLTSCKRCIEDQLASCPKNKRTELKKQQKKLAEQCFEMELYLEKARELAKSSIHLYSDDGIKHNYQKLAELLEVIK